MSSKPYCPTYAANTFVAPIEEQPDTISAKVSNFEKITAGIAMYTVTNLLIYSTQGPEDEVSGKAWQYLAPVVVGAMIYGLVKYKAQSTGLRKQYRYLKDSLLQTIPKDSYVTRADKENFQVLLDSLYAPTLKAHGY